MIAMTDLDDPNPISGMPYRMATALRAQGIEIIPVSAQTSPNDSVGLSAWAGNRIISIHSRRTPVWIKRAMDNLLPNRTWKVVLKRSKRLSLQAQRSLDQLIQRGEHIDALFGCCISTAISEIDTDLPIVYFSDATSPIIRATYPVLAQRGSSFCEALQHVEELALAKTDIAVFAAPATQESAITHLGVHQDKTRVVPMGAHVYPADPSSIDAPTNPPTREHCELLIVAADPIRKRVDLATQCTEILQSRGIHAKLHVIGPGTECSRSSKHVNSLGRLKLSDPTDRALHQQLLRDSHLQLLPSIGEAFGIAPIESAHFARPSIVADAGGLPFVVLHCQTGIVQSATDDAENWADSIEMIIDRPEKYKEMSTAALNRAREELNWDSWGRSIATIIREQIQQSAAAETSSVV